MSDVLAVTTHLPRPMVDELIDGSERRGRTLGQELKAALATRLYLDAAVKDGAVILVQGTGGELTQIRLP